MPRSKGRSGSRKAGAGAARAYPAPAAPSARNVTQTPANTRTSSRPATQGQLTQPGSGPRGAAATERRLTPRQEAALKRIQRRRRLQIIIAALVTVALVIAGIFLVQYLNTPTSFAGLPATPTTDTAPFTLGNADAKVTLIEYGDFRCPICHDYFTNDEKTIRENYVKSGKVKYVFRNFTVIDDRLGDTGSTLAAQAGYCASDQKRFWDYHDALYTNFVGETTGVPTPKFLKDLAHALNLDSNQFNSCLDAGKNRQQIATEKQDAVSKGVTGTPSFFVKVADKEDMIQITSAGLGASISAKLDDALKQVGDTK